MAKKLVEVAVQRQAAGHWHVWADPSYESALKAIDAITDLHWNETFKLFSFTPDPRYDLDDLEREIIELCR